MIYSICTNIFSSDSQHNDDDRSLEKRLQVIDGVIGSGINRRLMLGNGKGDFRPWLVCS